MLIYYALAAVLLGILIIVHEIGHFVACRLSGVRVERFSIGFGPKLLQKTIGNTEFAISAIPLGGYVKMAGSEHVADPTGAPPDSFVAKPLVLRAFILAAGPVMNFVWAAIVIIGVLMIAGLPTFGDPVIGVVVEGSIAEQAGIVTGDRVASVNGEETANWAELYGAIADAETELVLGFDDGREVRFDLPTAGSDEAAVFDLGIKPHVPPVVGGVQGESPAAGAGIRTGDRLISIDGVATADWYAVGDAIYDRPDKEIEVVWERDGVQMRAVLRTDVGEEQTGEGEVREIGLIGIMRPWATRRLGPVEAFLGSARFTGGTFVQVCDFFWQLVTFRASAEQLGGPIRVVRMASESARWGGSYFFTFMAIMSVNLCVINLLPLPILDGGHLLLLLLEKLRRRRLTERQLLIWQQTGLVFFGAVMVLLIVRDIMGLR
ncbi:RIP metalloprotease RseP [bacterium]|nr:RIP metalloprotease RseP [bacterium]